jgi:hypothetical protein
MWKIWFSETHGEGGGGGGVSKIKQNNWRNEKTTEKRETFNYRWQEKEHNFVWMLLGVTCLFFSQDSMIMKTLDLWELITWNENRGFMMYLFMLKRIIREGSRLEETGAKDSCSETAGRRIFLILTLSCIPANERRYSLNISLIYMLLVYCNLNCL